MRASSRSATLVLVPLAAGLLSGCSVSPHLLLSPLAAVPTDVGPLVSPNARTLGVTVRDARPTDDVLGGGILGPAWEKGKGLYLAYLPPKPEDVSRTFETAAREAAGVLGFAPGSDLTLELTVEAFRIELYRLSGWSPMNCVAYGRLGARLAEAGGRELSRRTLAVTYFENTTPAMSMKEVTREAISRIYQLAAWEAVAAALVEPLGLKANPERLSRLLASLDATKDEIVNRRRAFWLGLVGAGERAVAEKLLGVVRTSKDPRYRQGAAEALGMLRAPDAGPELSRILTSPAYGDWNREDTEQVWYVLKALGKLGETDLAAKIPSVKLNARSKLVSLVRFLETGEIPTPTAEEARELAKARANLKR